MIAVDASIQTWPVHIAATSVIFTHALPSTAGFYLTKGSDETGRFLRMWSAHAALYRWRSPLAAYRNNVIAGSAIGALSAWFLTRAATLPPERRLLFTGPRLNGIVLSYS
ncbi:hypothetical protein AWB82_01984 [Caballeronia glebae]|uniref:Uncharacterized protein n=1 Tax=Caballeronia glebae TaxID=1777143 RepID=A0A158A9U0_9BURK|nr:hypothetical protein [Caballeronia glebae]SAK54601.1 hypothetical protein AWB82_01984 [Caballeronia glebae]